MVPFPRMTILSGSRSPRSGHIVVMSYGTTQKMNSRLCALTSPSSHMMFSPLCWIIKRKGRGTILAKVALEGNDRVPQRRLKPVVICWISVTKSTFVRTIGSKAQRYVRAEEILGEVLQRVDRIHHQSAENQSLGKERLLLRSLSQHLSQMRNLGVFIK